MKKHFKHTLICPYGRFMNDTANPLVKTRRYGGWVAAMRKMFPIHYNNKCRLYWEDRFRYYRKRLVV